MRINVEKAFGLLINRWSIYKAGLDMALDFAHEVIESSLLLHNWLIENVRDVHTKRDFNDEEAEEQ